jgi:hypothetical protein
MSIYRGAGGAGDAVADGSSEALLIRELAIEVQVDADAAASSATAASGSASSASTSATNASNSATSASTSASTATTQASNASTSATNAASSATSAAGSATTATTQAGIATTQATNASNSASAAATSATTATTQAGIATTQATNASNSATAASTSATNASNSATSAATSATNASNSAAAAAASAASINPASISITGGSINGTTVGATTPSTGKFTTLEATGVATFSAGTVSAPAITTTGDTNTGMFFPAADTIAFSEGGVESMRIDSAGNVGIGTSSPAQKLSIQGASFVGAGFNGVAIGDTSAERIRIGYKNGTPDTGQVAAQIVADTSLLQIASRDTAGGTITFATGSGIPERMRINSVGNLLVGNSGAFTISKVMAQGDFGVIRSINGTSGSPVTDKALSFVAGNNQVYANISFLNSLTSDSSTWMAFNVTSAGSSTPVEAMRITSTSNVGIGTNAPSVRLDVNVSNPTRGIVARVRNPATSSFTGAQLLFTQNTVADWVIGQPANTDAFAFWNARNSVVDGTEAMRITSENNLLIGVSVGFTVSKVMALGDFGVIRSTNGTVASPITNRALSYVMGNNQVYSHISFANSVSSNNATWITFSTTPAASLTPVQRVIINSEGLVGINTNTPNNNLQVNGGITATAIAATTASITSTLGTGGFNIVFSGTFNNTSVANALGGYNSQTGVIYINGTGGTASIPFWSNGGAGVAWQFQWIIPGSSAIQSPSGTSTFTLGGTGGSTFTLTFTGANGQVTLTRTAGSGSFTAYVQLLGS